METNQQTNCYNCSRPLPQTGYFCGGCLTQIKCKSCGSSLEKDDAGCVICGTPKEVRAETKADSHQNINTFRLHETPTDRIIEATRYIFCSYLTKGCRCYPSRTQKKKSQPTHKAHAQALHFLRKEAVCKS